VEESNIKMKLTAFVLGFIGLAILVIILMGFRTVDAGEVAVVRRFGAVTGRILEPGAHFITPFVESTTYINTKFLLYETMKDGDIKNSKSAYKETQVDTNTKDGQRVDLYYTIRFSIDPKFASRIVQNFGSEQILVDNIVRAESRSKARIIPSNFSAEDLYIGKGKEEVANALFKELKDKFAENGIRLDTVLVRELGFTDQYVQAIEAKQIAFVQVETEKNKAEQAKYQKEQRITQAEGQAQEQKLQRETISVELLQKMLIEKWNGQYPQYLIIGGGEQFILPLPNK
jgi:regulator of protease activity HflC (stomatin/prohibitin superfamily)